MTDQTVLTNLRTAHYGDWGLDLTSQDVHELWGEIETRDKRVAELEALVQRLVEAGDRLSDSLCTYPEEDKTIEVMNWNAIVAEYKEREE